MDVNGTKFHLLQKKDEDWGECFSEGSDQPLRAAWTDHKEEADVEYEEPFGPLRLRQLTTLFRRFVRRSDTDFMKIEQRRGAASDKYGNIYWVDDAGTGILVQPSQSDHGVQYWTSTVSPAPAVSSSFHPIPPQTPTLPLQLYGLTVTIHHYLVVGYAAYKEPSGGVGDNVIDQTGVLIFDLYQNNLPDQRVWPPADDDYLFMPHDMAPAPDGGVYILDYGIKKVKKEPEKDPKDEYKYVKYQRFWVLDKHFRVRVKLGSSPVSPFYPMNDPPPTQSTPSPQKQATTANGQTDLVLTTFAPISIESGPDGQIFILDQGKGDDPVFEEGNDSVLGNPPAILVYRPKVDEPDVYYADQRLVLRVRIPDAEIEQGRIVGVVGQDFVYDSEQSRFYVADQEGNQVIAFQVDWAALPTKTTSSGIQAIDILLDGEPDYIPLRRWGGRALVHRGNRVYYDFVDHWVPMQILESCEFARRAVILTSTEFEPGQTFDSTILGCVWHRILLDAEIPASTSISFRARASDDQDLLPFTPWEDQPIPYLRTGGAELPYYRHPQLPSPPDQAFETSTDDPNDNPMAGTWELLLQAAKGRYLQLEITLEGTGRSTPKIYAMRVWYPRFSYLEHYLPAIYREEKLQADFLDRWLANFEGLFTHLEDKIQNLPRLLDPRSTPAEALDWLAGWMGLILDPLWGENQRRFFIRHVNEFYKRRGTKRGLELTLRLYLDENLDETTFWTDTSFHKYLRIEELCIRRGLSGFSDPLEHRFLVLVPINTTDDNANMISRIVSLEKPAHTLFQLQSSSDSFVVGQALLGMDTQLSSSIRASDGFIRLDTTRLLNGYLSPPYPLDVQDRLVMERDQLGDLPEL